MTKLRRPSRRSYVVHLVNPYLSVEISSWNEETAACIATKRYGGTVAVVYEAGEDEDVDIADDPAAAD